MKRRQLKKIVKKLSPGSPARFRASATVKRAWLARVRVLRPAPVRTIFPMYYDYGRDGVPVETDLWGWCYLFEYEPWRRVVAQTLVTGEDGVTVQVSTVFMGMAIAGPFESMVFGGPLHHTQERYRTRGEAQEGHNALVTRCKSILYAPEAEEQAEEEA